MRFTEFGPSIPNTLLDARDAGGVIFLCGAGVSIPAGLPDFFRLTSDVALRLGCAEESIAVMLIARERQRRHSGGDQALSDAVPFDRIFSFLIRDFGSSQVATEVLKALAT